VKGVEVEVEVEVECLEETMSSRVTSRAVIVIGLALFGWAGLKKVKAILDGILIFDNGSITDIIKEGYRQLPGGVKL
jgi:hypothetical protein